MQTIKKMLRFIWSYLRYYKVTFFVSILCATFSGLGAVGIIFLLQFAVQAATEGAFNKVTIICAGLVGYMIVAFPIQYFQFWFNARYAQRIALRIRNDLFKKINELPMKYFDKNTPGEIMSNFTNDINNITVFLSDNFAELVGILVWLTGMVIAMFVISWLLSIITLIMISFVLMLVIYKIKKSNPYFEKLHHEMGRFTSFIEEQIAGQPIIDLFEQQKEISKQFEKMQIKIAEQWNGAWLYSLHSYPIVDGLCNIVLVLTMACGVLFTNFDVKFISLSILESGSSGLIVLSIYILLTKNFIGSLYQLPTIINVALGAKVGIDRVKAVLDQKNEYTDIEKLSIQLALEKNKISENVVKPNIKFKNVNFSYIKDQPILKNISFEIKEKQFIGIVGPTGSGKTTVINLLTKLYEIDSGKILIGDKQISKINRDSLRKNISLVLQDTFLFAKSVKDNIRLAKPNATDEEIIDACQKAYCHNIITELPQGYDTILSNESLQLSKGQKQLIAIARALLTDAKIIIFDEATSSVDVKTEALIQKAMANLFKSRTIIMIAHSLSTIRNADKIIVIKDGHLIEQGNHDELMKFNGFYRQINDSKINELD